MSTDFEIYNTIIAILFSFYVFLTFTEKKKYISNLAAGFALYLIALSMFVFRDTIVLQTNEQIFYIFLKTSYFSAPFFIYNALSEFANKKIKTYWGFLLLLSIGWIVVSELIGIAFNTQLILLVCIGAGIYIYTAYITINFKQIGAPIRILASLILLALSCMFIYVPFMKTGDTIEFIDMALKSSIFLVIGLMVSLIMMYFQKVRATLLEQQQQIEYLNYHDEITGLYNKTYFDQKRDIFLMKNNYPISSIVIDSAALSIVNSKYGIFSNEEVLKEAAEEFWKIKKENEIFYKLGSEEILIILLNTNYNEAKKRAHDYHKMIEPESNENSDAFMFGIGTLFSLSTEPYKLVEEALSNLYINKLINNKNYISNFISYFTLKIHQLEGKDEERLNKVKRIAMNIGYKIGLEETEMEYLSKMCDIYDIGKISIPSRILEKKDSLNEDEWEIVKRYPDFSYDIVYTVYEDKELAEAVRAVRETWDGNGYPKGLSKTKIPRIARILSIVESYDAMINSVVSNKKEIKEAIAEIERNKGKQFDPEYVDIFIEYMKDKFEL